MKKTTRLTALLLCAALLFSMIGCTQAPAATTVPTEAPTTVPTEPPAEDLYAQARAALDSAEHISLDLLITTRTTVAGDEFSQESAQTLTYQGQGTEDTIIVMDETLAFSVHSEDYDPNAKDAPVLAYREIWHQGTVYAELEDTLRYCGSVDAEAAAARYTPAVLLNAELYGSITAQDDSDGTLITFAEPTAPETWAVPEEAELVEASGTALISDQGAIVRMSYTITYKHGPAEVTLEVHSSPLDTPTTVAAPADVDAYTATEYVDALRLSMTLPMMIAQADSITTSQLESVFCQAAGVMRNQSTVLNLHGRQEETRAKIEIGVYIMDYTTRESDEYNQEELFNNGEYTYTVNDDAPIPDPSITWEDIRAYCADMSIPAQLDITCWEDITVSDLGSVLLLEYQLSDEFGTDTQHAICATLWEDPDFLDGYSTHYETSQVSGYLSVDKYTGLPVAAGLSYEGFHTIDGQNYVLTLQSDQSFEAPSKGAYQEITDEMPEEPEPENKPTPLFYHVTGENGQEMWLLGTIHVGDERTAYLPAEIYDAFAASDALALECDTEAFDEQLEQDDALSEQVSNMYFYAGGLVSVEGLMEDEDYAQALKVLKATGNHNMNMPHAKPYVWSSSIDQFYMRQGYQLHSSQGVEERLHDWAEALDKPIREVESNLFQIKMLTGFSNDLQLMMLEDSVENSARDYWESVWELYEQWCAGDEAALREALSDEVDMTDWTEEEIAEYESVKHLLDEYNKAMSYDRNEGMLQKAIEYLESGDVVFYAVGLAHLLNDVNGLVDALRNAGYTVEQVTYGG